MGGRLLYRICFVGCCFQVQFNIARSILVQFPSSFFSIRLVSVQVVHPYCSLDMTAAWIYGEMVDFGNSEEMIRHIHWHFLKTWILRYSLKKIHFNFTNKWKDIFNFYFWFEFNSFSKLHYLTLFSFRETKPHNRINSWLGALTGIAQGGKKKAF